MNETRTWYCDKWDKTIIIKSKSEEFNSKTIYGIVVKECEVVKPKYDEVDYILDDIIKDCRDKFFHKLENICTYDIKFLSFANNEEVILAITNLFFCFKTEFYGLNEIIKKHRQMDLDLVK